VLRRLPFAAILLSLSLLAARVLRVPSLADPTGNTLPAGVHLEFPALNLLFSPLFDLWDNVSMLSMSRLTGFTAGMALTYLLVRLAAAIRRRKKDPDAGPPIGLIREAGLLLVAVLLFFGFVAGGMLWHRPMASLAGAPREMMVVDFHSHTNASHDVQGSLMKGFDAEANRRWHARSGFDAAFITDHNTIDGFPAQWASTGGTLLCPGIEVSAWRAHIILPGASAAVDRSPYSDSLEGVLRLLQESESKFGAVSIASLPEYERNHWANLEALVAAGIDGFEIVNASPKANEFTLAHRDSVIATARKHDLLLVAVTDGHGWGATVLAWNLVRVPGWSANGEDACGRLLASLKNGGAATVQIAERHHLRAESRWPWILTPFGVVWETWRALSPLQVLSWLIWIWTVGLLAASQKSGGDGSVRHSPSTAINT
jgi:hypothetical protein